MNGRRKWLAIPVAVGLLTAACGGGTGGGAPKAVSGTAASQGSAPGAQAGGGLKPLTFGIEVTSATQLPAWVALDKGYFKRYGLNVREILMGTSAKTAAGLLSGGIDMAYLEPTSTISADASGGNIVVVGDLLSTFPEWLYGAKGVTSMSQLRGKKVGIPSLGSIGELLVGCALKQAGLNPQRDVTLINIGGQPEVTSALESGAIAGGPVVPPFTFRAAAAGLKPLAFLGKVKSCPKLAPEIVSTDSFVRAHPRRVTAFLKAHMAAIREIQRNKAYAVADLLKHTKVNKAVAQKTYGQVLPYFAQPGKPVLSQQSARELISFVAASVNPAAKSVQPQQILDYSLYQKLIRSGFVKTLK